METTIQLLEVMNNHGFVLSLDHTSTKEIWEMTPKADIGRLKNKLHVMGLFLRIFKTHAVVEPKGQLMEEELADVISWAQDMGYHVCKENESYLLQHGWKKMYLYVEKRPLRGRMQRIIMAEFLNRHENISDLISVWKVFQGIETKTEYVLGSILGYTTKPLEFSYV